MPKTIIVPEREFYDEKSGRFITTKRTVLQLEHSLRSIRDWEAKHHKPYLSKETKTDAETLDYFRCMCINRSDVDPMVFRALSNRQRKEIFDYMNDPMTAVTLHRPNNGPSRGIVTAIRVYFWMSNYGIPFDPCEKWHFNMLMALIDEAVDKNNPKKKSGRLTAAQARERAALNDQRRAARHSRG